MYKILYFLLMNHLILFYIEKKRSNKIKLVQSIKLD